MILLTKLGTRVRPSGKNKDSWGLFQCPECGRVGEYKLGPGRRYLSCGCNRRKRQGESRRTHGYAIGGNGGWRTIICQASK